MARWIQPVTLKGEQVELRTHWHNRQSRQAIARLGAKQNLRYLLERGGQ